MCNFFTCIVTTTGDVLFTEENSHDTIIMRAGLIDDLKHFVRIEYTPIGGYIIDEKGIPEWYERMAAKAKESVKVAHNKVVAAHNAMMKIRNKAFEEYKAEYKRHTSTYDKWDMSCTQNWLKYREIKGKAIQDYKDSIVKVEGYLDLTP